MYFKKALIKAFYPENKYKTNEQHIYKGDQKMILNGIIKCCRRKDNSVKAWICVCAHAC